MSKIVIFGATSAIAERFARICALRGDEICLVARNEQKLLAIKQDLEIRGAKQVQIFCLDLNERNLHEDLVSSVFSKEKKVDLVLFAHGILGDQSLAERKFSHAENIISSNFTSTVSLLHEVAKHFEIQRSGIIVVISSVAGDRGRASNYVYGSSKAALSAFCSGLRQRMYRFGVSVITVKPGFVDTPMTRDFKKGILWVKPERIARGIHWAVKNRKPVVYLPRFWFLIMLVIKIIPEKIFQKLKI
jgi:decaprenylphospho-beta-D-erythro-pentofuranosid-2-ulose 2-reductase